MTCPFCWLQFVPRNPFHVLQNEPFKNNSAFDFNRHKVLRMKSKLSMQCYRSGCCIPYLQLPLHGRRHRDQTCSILSKYALPRESCSDPDGLNFVSSLELQTPKENGSSFFFLNQPIFVKTVKEIKIQAYLMDVGKEDTSEINTNW